MTRKVPRYVSFPRQQEAASSTLDGCLFGNGDGDVVDLINKECGIGLVGIQRVEYHVGARHILVPSRTS